MFFLKGFLLPVFLLILLVIPVLIFLLGAVYYGALYVIWDKLDDISSFLSGVFVFLCICLTFGFLYMLFSEDSAIHLLFVPIRNLVNNYIDFLNSFYPWLEEFLDSFSSFFAFRRLMVSPPDRQLFRHSDQ